MNEGDLQNPASPVAWPNESELQALGRVIQAASSLEHCLREAFCTLVGSKYAAVIVGGDLAGSLIDKCKALTEAQREISASQKQRIKDLLALCAAASQARNRLVHDMWAFGPGAETHQLRRERTGYGLSQRPVTTEEIERIASDLTTTSVQLGLALSSIFGPERTTLEAQLRWQEHVASMPPQDLANLLVRRLQGMLGELSRLLARYGEQARSAWADGARDIVKADLSAGLAVIGAEFENETGVSSVVLHGDPSGYVPDFLQNQDPNAQLNELRRQISELTAYLADNGSPGS
jgi:hypothetical protein